MDWRTATLTVPRQRVVSQIGENHDSQATAFALEIDFDKIHDPNEATLDKLKKDVLRMMKDSQTEKANFWHIYTTLCRFDDIKDEFLARVRHGLRFVRHINRLANGLWKEYDLVRARVAKHQLVFWEASEWERRARV
ncbi:MAG: hypothetical protein GXX80_12855 [Thermotogaceae bacterium]|nr:hypothetical protein [Thermotogaceae bacterium]